jgi:hypothetical protein
MAESLEGQAAASEDDAEARTLRADAVLRRTAADDLRIRARSGQTHRP